MKKPYYNNTKDIWNQPFNYDTTVCSMCNTARLFLLVPVGDIKALLNSVEANRPQQRSTLNRLHSIWQANGTMFLF